MSHKPVYHLLTSDEGLQALGITSDSLKGSTVHQSPDMRPWGIVKWGDVTPFTATSGPELLELWVYDQPGSYDTINKILRRARQVLHDNADVVIGGERFSTAIWRGDSVELYDDIYKCIVRYATFTVAGGPM